VTKVPSVAVMLPCFDESLKQFLKNSYCIPFLLLSFPIFLSSYFLSLSIDKCCVLNIGILQFDTILSVHGVVLPVVQSQRDLDVIVFRDLSPTNHINDIVVKAHRRANLILRAFESRDVCLLLRAFLVYVRPLLEYNSVLWSPCTMKDIQAIENVQRRFTKRLHGLKSFTYQERLMRLGISRWSFVDYMLI